MNNQNPTHLRRMTRICPKNPAAEDLHITEIPLGPRKRGRKKAASYLFIVRRINRKCYCSKSGTRSTPGEFPSHHNSPFEGYWGELTPWSCCFLILPSQCSVEAQLKFSSSAFCFCCWCACFSLYLFLQHRRGFMSLNVVFFFSLPDTL